MRRSLTLALLLPAFALSLAGCGKQEPVTTPVACLGGLHQWLSALNEINDTGQTPVEAEVNLGGETLISDCIPPDQPAGQQETVGRTAVDVATGLARRTRSTGPPDSDAVWMVPLRSAYAAGYLVGALERGAKSSQGIHATLVDRVESAATNGLDARPEALQEAYEEGRGAGLESG